MKKTFFTIVLIVSAIALAFASDSVIKSFTAESGGDSVTIKWNTESENNVKQFEIERATTDNVFKRIHIKNASGKPSNYSFLDEEAFMKQDGTDSEIKLQNVYSYRIKILYKDNNTTYSDEAYVTHKPSSIRRTWGMIKEMFR